MAFKILRNDITKVCADAIVNTANPLPVIGRGTDETVYEAAGRDELLESRKKIGAIERGQSAFTPSFKLKKNGVKFIIHTVGVRYQDGSHGEKEILRSCYASALKLAAELKCKSIAIPLLATGNYKFPKDLALQIAVEEISRFLLENEIAVFLVVYDEQSYKISEKLFADVEDFLCDNFEFYEDYDHEDLRCAELLESYPTSSPDRALSAETIFSECSTIGAPPPKPVKICATRISEKQITPIDVDAFINISKENLNFQNTLQQLIADRKVDNATIYKKAGIDKKFFSKIISNKDYVPKKHTVMALGLALELPLVEYEAFLASAGYAFMPSSRFDMIIKYCVINEIFNLLTVDVILDDHGEECFSPN